MAAVLNMVGAFVSQNVAKTVGKGIVTLPTDSQTVVLAALIGAICWNLVTWYLGLPSSSSHALIGGLVGATLVAVGTSGVEWSGIWHKVVVPMVSSPLVGLLVAFLLMNLLLLLVFRWSPRPVNRTFRALQPVSAGAVALAHGMNDAQKTMGVIWLALITSGHLSKTRPDPHLGDPGGRLVDRAGHLLRRLAHHPHAGHEGHPARPDPRFAAETSSAAVICTAATSATRSRRPRRSRPRSWVPVRPAGCRAVKWGVAGNIVWAWVLTIPAAGLVAAGVYFSHPSSTDAPTSAAFAHAGRQGRC